MTGPRHTHARSIRLEAARRGLTFEQVAADFDRAVEGWAELEVAYAASVVEVQVDPSRDEWVGAVDACLVVGEPYFVVTAHNPMSVLLSDDENAQRNRELASSLGSILAPTEVIRPAIGRSADHRWSEASFAVPATPAVAHLAIDFGQAAVFRVNRAGWSVERLVHRREPAAVRPRRRGGEP